MLAATWADTAAVFGILYAIGAGVTGATGFYHVATAAASRLRADRPDRAIAVVTEIGALCSPIYLPLTTWLVTIWHWRPVARLLAALVIVGAVLAAIVPAVAPPTAMRAPQPTLGGPCRGRYEPRPFAVLVVYVAAGIAFTSVLVYQDPILAGAGVGLGTAGDRRLTYEVSGRSSGGSV